MNEIYTSSRLILAHAAYREITVPVLLLVPCFSNCPNIATFIIIPMAKVGELECDVDGTLSLVHTQKCFYFLYRYVPRYETLFSLIYSCPWLDQNRDPSTIGKCSITTLFFSSNLCNILVPCWCHFLIVKL